MDQAKDRGGRGHELRVVSGSGQRGEGRSAGSRAVGPSPVEAGAPVVEPSLPLPPSPNRRAARGLAAVLARIREDARVEPGTFLEGCEVPSGGE